MTRFLTAAAFALAAMVGPAMAQDAAQDPVEVEEMALGNPDAPVTVTEYASFTCPHCANFHQSTFERMRE